MADGGDSYDDLMLKGGLSEYHGALGKMIRMDRYYWEVRRSRKNRAWHEVKEYTESIYAEIESWMSEKERELFLPKWTKFLEEYANFCRQRPNNFRGHSFVVELYLRRLVKAHGLDAKERRDYMRGGALG